MAEHLVAEADKRTGEAKCRYYRARITFLYDDQVRRISALCENKHVIWEYWSKSKISVSYTPVCNIFVISNNRGRSLFEAFDWLFICDDPSDVRDLRVKVVVEIETPYTTVPRIVTSLVLFTCLMFGHYFIF